MEAVVSKKAGLLGVSELSSDMRDLRDAIAHGNAKARLAVEKFTWTIAKWIGGYVAELGGLDMLAFTGGIGENDIASRSEICAGLGMLGIVLDATRNNVQVPRRVISAEKLAGHCARHSPGGRSDDRPSCSPAAGQLAATAFSCRDHPCNTIMQAGRNNLCIENMSRVTLSSS